MRLEIRVTLEAYLGIRVKIEAVGKPCPVSGLATGIQHGVLDVMRRP